MNLHRINIFNVKLVGEAFGCCGKAQRQIHIRCRLSGIFHRREDGFLSRKAHKVGIVYDARCLDAGFSLTKELEINKINRKIEKFEEFDTDFLLEGFI